MSRPRDEVASLGKRQAITARHPPAVARLERGSAAPTARPATNPLPSRRLTPPPPLRPNSSLRGGPVASERLRGRPSPPGALPSTLIRLSRVEPGPNYLCQLTLLQPHQEVPVTTRPPGSPTAHTECMSTKVASRGPVRPRFSGAQSLTAWKCVSANGHTTPTCSRPGSPRPTSRSPDGAGAGSGSLLADLAGVVLGAKPNVGVQASGNRCHQLTSLGQGVAISVCQSRRLPLAERLGLSAQMPPSRSYQQVAQCWASTAPSRISSRTGCSPNHCRADGHGHVYFTCTLRCASRAAAPPRAVKTQEPVPFTSATIQTWPGLQLGQVKSG